MAMTTRETLLGVLPIPARAPKPRNAGLTIAVEFGVSTVEQRGLLEVAGDTLDLAKIAVGIAGIIPPEQLRAKVELYREFAVQAFPGGMFLEYAYAKGLVPQYLDWSEEVGFSVIEVSDNAVPVGHDKADIVTLARERGLTVLGEVGSKGVVTSTKALIDDAQRLLDAGCWKVLVEAAEFFDGGVLRTELVEAIEQQLPVDDIVFELPGPWLSGIHHHDVASFEAWLVQRFGPDVNIANDPWGNSLFLETYRRGLGPNLLERL